MNGLLQDVGLIGGNITWLREFRAAGREAFERSGIPTAKTEAWKYTKPGRFLSAGFNVNPRGVSEFPSPVALPFPAYVISFENGVFNRADSKIPDGVEVLPLIEGIERQPEVVRRKMGSLAKVEEYPFAALNAAYLNEGILIRVDSGVHLVEPLALVHHVSASSENLQYNLRNIIIVGDAGSATFVEYFCYDGAPKSSYLVNTVNEFFIGRGAALRHYKLQDEAFKAGHLSLTVADVAADGLYKAFCLQKGADLARHESAVRLAGIGARAEVDAAYIMNGWATIDTTTDIEHLKPYTKSSQLVKGVVGGQARGVFQGKIRIAPDAVKTEGYQLHKAMLLSDEAEIDVKPELEIFADDVKCSHGAACGQLDAEQLFYMRSRGIGEKEAEQMLIDAYLNDVIAKVDDENIRRWIKLSVGANQSA